MPTYIYVCSDEECGTRMEAHHSMSESPDVFCDCGEFMRKDVAASFPHVSLKWHRDQGIGERLVLASTSRRSLHGNTTRSVHVL
jgi:hypothetical protein